MRLDKIILDDFLTYEHLEHEIDRRPLLIQGLNKTDEGQKSNGSGKSGIQTAIEFCITASNSRDVRDNELVTYGHKEARAQLFASCDQRKELLHIDWTIKVKGSNKLVLKKKIGSEDWKEVSFSNVNDGKKYVLAWFAISKEDLFNYFIINKTRFKTFFKSSQKEKVDLVNRFSDASIVSGLDEIDDEALLDQERSINTQINKLEGVIESNQEKLQKELIRNLDEEVTEAQEELEEGIIDIREEIDTLDADNSIVDEKIFNIDQEITDIIFNKEIAIADRGDIEKDIESQGREVKKDEDIVRKARAILLEFKKTDWDEERKDFQADLDTDNSSLSSTRTEKREALEDFEQRGEKILKFIKTIDIKLSGTIKCPKCTHKFMPTNTGETVAELEKKKKQIKELLERNVNSSDHQKTESDRKIKSLNKDIEDLEKELSKISNKERLENADREIIINDIEEKKKNLSHEERKLNRLNAELIQVDKDITTYSNDVEKEKLKITSEKEALKNRLVEIENYKKEITNIEKEIKALKPEDNKSVIKGLKFENSLLAKDKASKEAELKLVGDKLYEINQWKANFKQFRMHLANQSLEVISYHCNRYLQDMNSDMIVEFEGFKTLANGSIKEEITAKITRNIERSFSSFSGGEQGRLLFASILANRHMINSTHPYGGLDFLSVDEVFEGVDSLGLKYLINSAKSLGIAVMIITHVTDEDTSDDVLLIVKENGVSRIKK